MKAKLALLGISTILTIVGFVLIYIGSGLMTALGTYFAVWSIGVLNALKQGTRKVKLK